MLFGCCTNFLTCDKHFFGHFPRNGSYTAKRRQRDLSTEIERSGGKRMRRCGKYNIPRRKRKAYTYENHDEDSRHAHPLYLCYYPGQYAGQRSPHPSCPPVQRLSVKNSSLTLRSVRLLFCDWKFQAQFVLTATRIRIFFPPEQPKLSYQPMSL